MFSNETHKTLFIKSPERYLPQFGGWCALGVGMSQKHFSYAPSIWDVDPKTFKIIDKKLYLFLNDVYDCKPYNALKEWEKYNKEKILLESGHQFWKTLMLK